MPNKPEAASSVCLDHKSDQFSPLDASQLNDCRMRIVNNKPITDAEICHSIQTFLYHDREAAMKLAAPKKKAARTKAPALDPNTNFDDLLNAPVKPS